MNRAQLAAIPDAIVAPSPAIVDGIAASVAYLASDDAVHSLSLDLYWPKWHSPWWHMLVLCELGEARQIPARAVDALVAAVIRFPLKTFPIRPDELPPGVDPKRGVLCHCALASVYQMLAACGAALERAVDCAPAWFARYQMADGGLSCDATAYTVAGECPSSMVGTIAPFEAMLVHADHHADAATAVLERGARFLIARQLVHGSATAHNADERAAAAAWPQPCFPRFYFYDVLRGVAALVRWAERTGAVIPHAAIADAVDGLVARCPDGVVAVGRCAHADHTTLVPAAPGPRVPAATFPLLDAVSVVGAPSPALTRQWTAARHGLIRLFDAGQIV